ncbi:LysR family transcriptional regulator ArgP [Gordonia sinesedis]
MVDIGPDGLRTLAAVLREGTFEAAAEALHVTPSAVSQRVKAMEVAVGRVLVRRSKPVTATPDGEVLARLARQWELLTTEASSELIGAESLGVRSRGTRRADDLPAPRVHVPVAANADSLATWLLPVLATFHRDYPVAVEVLRADETITGRLLRSGDVVGAITSEPTGVRGCITVPLGSMRYLPVATPDFVERWLPSGPTTSALAAAPMVHFDRDDHLQQTVLRLLTDEPVDPPGVYIPASTEFYRAVEAGIGWGAVPRAQIEDALASGRLVRFVDRHIDVPLYWQYWRLSSPLVTALTELIRDGAGSALVPIG